MFDPRCFTFRMVEPDQRGGLFGGHGQVVLVDNGRCFVNGRRIDLSLQPVDVRLPSEIPTYLAGYHPMGFRADAMSQVIKIDKDEDYRRDFSSNNAYRRVNVKVGPEGAIPEVDPSSSLTKYKTVDRLLGSFVPTVTEDNAAGTHYRPRQVAAKRIGWALGLDREIDVITLLQTAGSWAAGNTVTLGAGARWNGGPTSDPMGDINARIIASAQEVTDIWMNQLVALTFLAHPTVRDQMRQMLGDGAAGAAAAQVWTAGKKNVDFMIPGLPPIHVSAAKVLNETTGNLDYVMGNHTLLLTQPPGVPTDGEDTATSYTFRVRGNQGVGYETREFRVEGRGQKGGQMVVVYQSDIAQMVGNNCGGAIFNCYQ